MIWHGTIIEEHISTWPARTSPQLQTEVAMIKAIREAGRTPVQRNTFYEQSRFWKTRLLLKRLKVPRARKFGRQSGDGVKIQSIRH